MKQSITFFILLGAISFLFNKANAQKTYTLDVGNQRLLIHCHQLEVLNNEAALKREVVPFFTQTIAHKIDSIKKRVTERDLFIKRFKKFNSNMLPKTFNNLEYQNLNHRIEIENGLLASDFLYCTMLENILSLTKRFKKNKKVYYADGKYQIPSQLVPKAKEVFEPIVDELIRVGNRFKGMQFTAMVKTTGYSDNSQINKGSDLYKDMSQRMQTADLTSEEIKMYLSHLRAYDVSSLLVNLWNDKQAYLLSKGNMHVTFQKNGLGTEKPTDQSLDLHSNKRRVVIVYWHILPKF